MGTVSAGELLPILRALADNDVCSLRGNDAENPSTLTVDAGGLRCSVRMGAHDWQATPRGRACLAALERLHALIRR
jgi:hypothetical protein